MRLLDLVRQFERCSLPKAEWTHIAHLKIGTYYVRKLGPEAARSELRQGIRKYNECVGTPNTDTGGYHETITCFYIQGIQHILDACDTHLSDDECAAVVIEQLGHKDAPLQYYSRALLFSVAARREWVTPDIGSTATFERESAKGTRNRQRRGFGVPRASEPPDRRPEP